LPAPTRDVIMWRGERGQALIEFAIILPLLIFILLGIAELGWYFVIRIALSNAATTGAEFAAYEGITDPDLVEERVREAANGVKLGSGDIIVLIASYQDKKGIKPKYALVQINYTYRPLVTGNLFRRTVTIKARAIRYYPSAPETAEFEAIPQTM